MIVALGGTSTLGLPCFWWQKVLVGRDRLESWYILRPKFIIGLLDKEFEMNKKEQKARGLLQLEFNPTK